MESIDKKFQDQINEGEDLTDLEKSNLNTFLELVISRLGKVDQTLKPLPLISGEEASYEKDDTKSRVIESEKLVEEKELIIEDLEAIVGGGGIPELLERDAEDLLLRDNEGNIKLTKQALKELVKEANRTNSKVSSKKAVIEKTGVISLEDPEKIKKQLLNNKSNNKKGSFNKNIKKKINSRNKNSLTKKVKGSVEIIKKDRINKNNAKERTSSEKKSTIEEVKEVPLELGDFSEWDNSEGGKSILYAFDLCNKIHSKGIQDLTLKEITFLNFITVKLNEMYPEHINFNLLKNADEFIAAKETIRFNFDRNTFTQGLLSLVLGIVFELNFDENFQYVKLANYNQRSRTNHLSLLTAYSHFIVILPKRQTQPGWVNFFPSTENQEEAFNDPIISTYTYSIIYFSKLSGFNIMLSTTADTIFPPDAGGNRFLESFSFFRLRHLKEINNQIQPTNFDPFVETQNTTYLTYQETIDNIVDEAFRIVFDNAGMQGFDFPPQWGTRLGLSQIWNTSLEAAEKNKELLLSFGKEIIGLSEEYQQNSNIELLSLEEKRHYANTYKNFIQKTITPYWSEDMFDSTSLYYFSLPQDWLDDINNPNSEDNFWGVRFFSYLFKGKLKPHLDKTFFLIQNNKKLFRRASSGNNMFVDILSKRKFDRLANVNINELLIEESTFEELTDEKVISLKHYWFSEDIRNIFKNKYSFIFLEYKNEIERRNATGNAWSSQDESIYLNNKFDKIRFIYDKILKKGDLVQVDIRGYLGDEQVDAVFPIYAIGMIVGDVRFDIKYNEAKGRFDEVLFYVPMIIAGTGLSLSISNEVDISSINYRLRFKEDDLLRDLVISNPKKESSNKKDIYYKVRNKK